MRPKPRPLRPDALQAEPTRRDAHTWTYPETALRNYARNDAEATERISHDVERRDTTGPITIRPVTPKNLADWRRFFDHDAFAGNPSWACCYCLEPHAPAPPRNPNAPATRPAP